MECEWTPLSNIGDRPIPVNAASLPLRLRSAYLSGIFWSSTATAVIALSGLPSMILSE